MKKRFIFIILALSLIITIVPATIILAQDEKPVEQNVAQFNLRIILERAFNQGIIDQDTLDRIKKTWRNASPDERSKLYERIINMIRCQHKKLISLKNSLFNALDKAVENDVINKDKANYIKRLWLKKPLDERRQLYRRVMNFLNTTS